MLSYQILGIYGTVRFCLDIVLDRIIDWLNDLLKQDIYITHSEAWVEPQKRVVSLWGGEDWVWLIHYNHELVEVVTAFMELTLTLVWIM